MKKQSLAILLAVMLPAAARSQGYFVLANDTAPTHLGSTNGSLAGRGIWAQALGGLTPDSLMPVGFPTEHDINGYVYAETIQVLWAPANTPIYVQMAAWDGGVWGTSFATIPANQLGYTDTVPILLSTPLHELYPQFTQSAIVPAVPEPSSALLLLVGVVALLFHRGLRAKLKSGRPFQ